MPGKMRMQLYALIEKSTTWYDYKYNAKETEEFYVNGELEKKVSYYANGSKESEYAFITNPKTIEWGPYQTNRSKKFGPCTLYYDTGVIESTGTMDGSLETGTWKYYGRTGILLTEKTNHTRDSATVINFYPSGKTESVYAFNRYRKIGTEKHFYETGELKSYTHFDKYGQQDTATISYHPNGTMLEYLPCCSYWPNGKFTRWYENGNKEEEVSMTDGIRVGLYTSWHPNGKVQSKGHYDEYGYPVGVWNYYKENGQKESTRNFDLEPEISVEPEIAPELVFEGEHSYLKTDFDFSVPQIGLTESYQNPIRKKIVSLVKKYSSILIRIDVDENGNAVYSILTPVKEKQQVLLQDFFRYNTFVNGPFRLTGKAVPVVILAELVYSEDQQNL
jgi:antitoxin component YwqK of YwqJK toxin-antitoxin module